MRGHLNRGPHACAAGTLPIFPASLRSYVNKSVVRTTIWKVLIEAQLISPVFGSSWKHSKHVFDAM